MKIRFSRVISLMLAVIMLFGVNISSSATQIKAQKPAGKVESVEIEDMTVRYRGKQGVNVTVRTNDKNLGFRVEYFSSDESIFTVDEEGYVIAGERGIAEITVKVTDDNGNTVTDTAEIEVKFSSRQWIIYILFFGWIWY